MQLWEYLCIRNKVLGYMSKYGIDGSWGIFIYSLLRNSVFLCFVLFFFWYFYFPCTFVLCNLVLSFLFSLISSSLDAWLLSNECGERKGIYFGWRHGGLWQSWERKKDNHNMFYNHENRKPIFVMTRVNTCNRKKIIGLSWILNEIGKE